jgi:serralysin
MATTKTGLVGDDATTIDILNAGDLVTFSSAELALNSGPLSPSAAGLNMVTFMTGLTSTGASAAQSYALWQGDTPATYSNVGAGRANAWGAGATVTYAFDPSAGFTAADKIVYITALNLWHDEANITFNLTSDYTNAQIQFTHTADGQAKTTTSYDITSLSSPATLAQATISIDNTAASFAQPSSFSYYGGYAKEVVLHEIGHALTLGHPGAYNNTVPTSSQILFPDTDTRQYSVMSYNNPNGNPYQGNYLTTPGQYDILAIQRIYGAPVTTGLSGGQVFGFNTNTGIAQFDFTQNTTPVVTLFDIGTGNTLDLSGFTSASTVNLNPGAFSSVAGLSNNIGIDFSTKIDTVITGAGNDTINVNSDADVIDGGGGSNTVLFNAASTAASMVNNGGVISVTIGGVTDTLRNIQYLNFTNVVVAASDIACFTLGTRILTPQGEVAVEALRAGDLVTLHDGSTAPLVWAGSREVVPEPEVLPLEILRGAFGPGLPSRSLVLSPEHALLIEGALVPVRCLEDGAAIRALPMARVTYYHLALEQHGVLLASGLPVESYRSDGDAGLYELTDNPPPARVMTPFAPILRQGPVVERARARLHRMEMMA